MNRKIQVFNKEAAQRISAATKWVEQHRVRASQDLSNPTEEVQRFSRHPLRIVITTEDIAPNTYGGFKFTTGAKGSETVTGDEYQGYYRNTEDDAPDIPEGTTCFAIWIPCSDLDTEAGETGWELTPEACIDA